MNSPDTTSRPTVPRPAVFIDRDGTISDEVGYVNHPSRYKVFPFAAEAIRQINNAGWLAILVTNQAGVARGYFSEDLIHVVHDLLQAELARGQARLDGIYYCPHHPTVGDAPYRQACDCRKPRPGLVTRAAAEHNIDLARSWMIGDRYSDIELARNANLRSAFVLTGYGRGEWDFSRHKWSEWRGEPDILAENLLAAVEGILAGADTANIINTSAKHDGATHNDVMNNRGEA